MAIAKSMYISKISEQIFSTLYLGDTQIAGISVGMTYPCKDYRIDRVKRSTDMFEFVISGKGYIVHDGDKGLCRQVIRSTFGRGRPMCNMRTSRSHTKKSG